jgi:hypothetical protein
MRLNSRRYGFESSQGIRRWKNSWKCWWQF